MSKTMTVSAKNGIVAVRTHYTDTEDFVQRIVSVFRDSTDPARRKNYPVDFENSYLISKNDDIWATTVNVFDTDGEISGDEAPTISINESYMAANHGQSDGVQITIKNRVNSTFAPELGTVPAHKAGIIYFVDCIENGKEIIGNAPEDSALSVKLVEKLIESSDKNGEFVKFIEEY